MDWLKRKLDLLSTEIVAVILGATLLAIGGAIWAMLHSWAAPLIMVLVLGIIGLCLWIWNQVYIIKERRSRAFANWNNDQIADTLQKWVLRRGFSIKETTLPNYQFAFQVDYWEKPIIVARHSTLDTFITFLGLIKVSQERQDMMQALTEREREKILRSIAIEFARLGVNYMGLKYPWATVEISHQVLCDNSLTEQQLLQSIKFVSRGIILFTHVLAQNLSGESTTDMEGSQSE